MMHGRKLLRGLAYLSPALFTGPARLAAAVGREMIAQNFCLPVWLEFANRADLARFSKFGLFSADEVRGGWAAAQKGLFALGSLFDEAQRQGAAR